MDRPLNRYESNHNLNPCAVGYQISPRLGRTCTSNAHAVKVYLSLKVHPSLIHNRRTHATISALHVGWGFLVGRRRVYSNGKFCGMLFQKSMVIDRYVIRMSLVIAKHRRNWRLLENIEVVMRLIAFDDSSEDISSFLFVERLSRQKMSAARCFVAVRSLRISLEPPPTAAGA